jgi:hypothetical protein
MIKFIHELLNSTQAKSSARFVNLVIALVITFVFLLDFLYNLKINIEAMLILATYAAGGFGISKGLDMLKPSTTTGTLPQ